MQFYLSRILKRMQQRLTKEVIALIIIFILASLVYLIYVLKIHPPWLYAYSDMYGYIDRAQRFVTGAPIVPGDSVYAPGTMFFYSIFFEFFHRQVAFEAIAVAQGLLAVGSCFIVYFLIRDVLKEPVGAWIGLGLSLVYFPLLIYAGFFLSETLFSFLLLFSIYYFYQAFIVKTGTWIGVLNAGLIAGFAWSVKGTYYFVIFFYLLYLVFREWKKIPYRKIALFIGGFVVFVVLQSVYISAALGTFKINSTNGGLATYLGQAHIRGIINDAPQGDYIFYNNNSYYDTSLGPVQSFNFGVWDDSAYYTLVKNLWEQDPWRQVKISAGDVVDLFRIVTHWPARNEPVLARLDLDFQWTYFGLVYLPALGCIGVWIFSKKRRAWLQPLVLFMVPILSVMATSAITKGEERYLVPYEYLFIIFAAWTWIRLYARITRARNSIPSVQSLK